MGRIISGWEMSWNKHLESNQNNRWLRLQSLAMFLQDKLYPTTFSLNTQCQQRIARVWCLLFNTLLSSLSLFTRTATSTNSWCIRTAASSHSWCTRTVQSTIRRWKVVIEKLDHLGKQVQRKDLGPLSRPFWIWPHLNEHHHHQLHTLIPFGGCTFRTCLPVQWFILQP